MSIQLLQHMLWARCLSMRASKNTIHVIIPESLQEAAAVASCKSGMGSIFRQTAPGTNAILCYKNFAADGGIMMQHRCGALETTMAF